MDTEYFSAKLVLDLSRLDELETEGSALLLLLQAAPLELEPEAVTAGAELLDTATASASSLLATTSLEFEGLALRKGDAGASLVSASLPFRYLK